MKVRNIAALAAVAALGLAACGGDDSSSNTTTASEGGGTTTTAGGGGSTECAARDSIDGADISIGVVTDVGKVDDKSFNQSTWEGAQSVADELGASADFIETTQAADYANNIQQFVDSGANVIVTIGFALGEATQKAAAANPDIMFIGVDQFQGTTACNVAGLVFHEDQAGFLVGALAGWLTKSNIVASVLGTNQVPAVVAYGKGFENGAKFANDGVDVITTYHPGGLDVAFSDPGWGGDTARQAIDNGADVVFGAGGQTGNGALIETAKKDGALCIGVDTDQWGTVPEAHPCLVTSAMKLLDQGVVDLVKQVNDGSIQGGNFYGKVGIADFHDLADRVPADVQTKISDLTEKVLSGEQDTGYTG
jgi:basic membrane protein A